MSIFSALFEQGKVYNFEQAFGVKDITSNSDAGGNQGLGSAVLSDGAYSG